jgi:hypothetical protein
VNIPETGYSRQLTLSSLIQARNVSITNSGKVGVPVDRQSYMYARFKHVHGVPVNDGARGVSLSRLKTLDILIDRLAKLKNTAVKLDPADKQDVNELISRYSNEIRSLLADPFKGSSAAAETAGGAVVSIFA